MRGYARLRYPSRILALIWGIHWSFLPIQHRLRAALNSICKRLLLVTPAAQSSRTQTVALRNVDTTVERTSVTNSAGEYVFSEHPSRQVYA